MEFVYRHEEDVKGFKIIGYVVEVESNTYIATVKVALAEGLLCEDFIDCKSAITWTRENIIKLVKQLEYNISLLGE